MYDSSTQFDFRDPHAGYAQLAEALGALLSGEHDPIANAANTAALLFTALPDINWAGFYFVRGRELVVGPFQGKPACVRIPFGRGVCGAAAERCATIVVPDVQTFADHIACDAASRSEVVVPLIERQSLLGVLDLDSPRPGRFGEIDARALERIAGIYLGASRFGAER